MKRRIAFYTLGCKVNQYETQKLEARFRALGYEVVGEAAAADVYVVNSCTVTGMADRKSRNFLRRAKRNNPDALLALIGCYAQTDGARLAAQMPEIDLLLGTAEKDSLPARVTALLDGGAPGAAPASEARGAGAEAAAGAAENESTVDAGDGLPAGGRTRAYLKIEDGCDRFCAYCVIPYARGPVRSRPEAEILAEAQDLLAAGYKELILTGINTALYGQDAGGAQTGGLADLVRKIAALDGDFRIRLGSVEPTVIDAAHAAELAAAPKLCPHFHLSLQSGSDRILAAMGRRYRMAEYQKIVAALRRIDPDFGISTDIIVGFPGETEADFAESLRAVEETDFAYIHVFKYSKRPGTRAAAMPDQVPEQVKSERSRRLLLAGEKAAAAFRARCAGKPRQALILRPLPAGRCEAITDNGLSITLPQEFPVNTFLAYAITR